jgi:hypothetical protein
VVGGPESRGSETAALLHARAKQDRSILPLAQSNRQLAVYDPKTQEWSHINTCFSADHNQIGADNLLYFGVGGGAAAIGWVDINTWDKTHDAEASQGWCPGIMDTNGDGKITAPWTEPTEPIDPTKDFRSPAALAPSADTNS